MGSILAWLTDSDLMPHGYCLRWDPGLVGLHVASDALIALAYFSIPVTLVLMGRRRGDMPFVWVFYLFGAFVFACGATHVMSIWTLWFANYAAEGILKAVTAGVSVAAAIALYPLMPKALAFRSPAELEAEIRMLETEIEERHERSAAAMREHAEQLESANKELEQFAHVASHDLKEPARNVVAGCELLREDLGNKLSQDAAEDLALIDNAGRRMQQLIEDLLTLSSARRGTRQMEMVSLDECVSRSLETLRVRVQESHAVVVRDPLPDVVGDPTLLAQLYQNLISNALKFNDKAEPRVEVTAERDGDTWRLGVRDNGIGLEAQYAEQIFQPFRRLHGRSEYEGSGIGLAICHEAVERHGGKLWVESEPGNGAYFRFSLPAANNSEADSE